MFSFGFSGDENECSIGNRNKLEWLVAKEIFPSGNLDNVTAKDILVGKAAGKAGVGLKLVPCDLALKIISQQKDCSIAEAESLHSDLVPAKYEGGLKIWECTEDLTNYLVDDKILTQLPGAKVLDLGCGSGILGIIAMQHGSSVHFQDYNEEVLRYLTYMNVGHNTKPNTLEECRYFCGDWESFADLTEAKYDWIFTSETIYNPECHSKLLSVFKKRLSDNGIVLLAAKTYYFGVGGGLRQFEKLLQDDGTFQSTVVWKCSLGVQREILRIQRR